MAVLVLGMLGYFVAELVQNKNEKNSFAIVDPSKGTEMALTNPALESEDQLAKKA
jgi:hypothetical protein